MSRFAHYAVETGDAPHVTVSAGVVHAGRFWTTTSLDSLKSSSVRTHHRASALIGDPDGVTLVNGRTVALSLVTPTEVLRDPLGSVRWAGAMARLVSSQLRDLFGYVETARRVPRNWFPDRRALLSTRIDRELRVTGDDVVSVRGSWDRPPMPMRRSRLPTSALEMSELPSLTDEQRALVTEGRPVRMGLMTPDGPVAIPARWTDERQLDVSNRALELLRVRLPGPACLVAHESSSRRPDEKLGVMLRGRALLTDVEGPTARLALDTERLTTWDGFEAETSPVPS